MDVAIINYGINNLYSVENALKQLNIKCFITDDKHKILGSKIAILPGVGAFKEAMNSLKQKKLDKTIYEFIETGKPFFGICLGMQLLFSESDEFVYSKGLDIIGGKVVKFKSDKKIIIPHVGWNKINLNEKIYKKSVLCNNTNNEFMYFVHSHYVIPDDQNIQLTKTNYEDTEYCSSLKKENITAFQFHPEKSGDAGMKIFKNIKRLLI